MAILIFAETYNGEFKKDCYELASYAYDLASEKNMSVTAICFNASNPSELSNFGVNKIINSSNEELKDFDATIYSDCICEAFENEDSKILILKR